MLLRSNEVDVCAQDGRPAYISFYDYQGNVIEKYKFEINQANFDAKLTANELHADNGVTGYINVGGMMLQFEDGILVGS